MEKVMNGENGDIKHEPSKEEAKFSPGMFVRIIPKIMDKVQMTPVELFKTGWPNKFMIVDIFDHSGQECLTLDPCCGWMVNRASGQHLCTGHPAKFFEGIPADPEDLEDKRGEHHAAVDLFGWRAVSLDYHENEKAIALKTPFSQKPVILTGEIFKGIMEQAKSLKWV